MSGAKRLLYAKKGDSSKLQKMWALLVDDIGIDEEDYDDGRFELTEWLRIQIGHFMPGYPPHGFDVNDRSCFCELEKFLANIGNKDDTHDLIIWLQEKIRELDNMSHVLEKEKEEEEKELENLHKIRRDLFVFGSDEDRKLMMQRVKQLSEVENQIWNLFTKICERSHPQRPRTSVPSQYEIKTACLAEEFSKYHANPRTSQYTFMQLLEMKRDTEESKAVWDHYCRYGTWPQRYADSESEDSDSELDSEDTYW
jgi:hypothetical protein